MSKSMVVFLFVLQWLLPSCVTHQVVFGELHPTVSSTKQPLELVAVIDKASREKSVPISSAMAGLANKWVVEAGDMLVQMSNTEFPSMFERYTLVESPPAAPGAQRIVLELALVDFQFHDFRTTLNLSARARGVDGAEMFSKTYTGVGQAEGGKVFWGGAFAMKSAIRQSSHAAFASVFSALAIDLAPRAGP